MKQLFLLFLMVSIYSFAYLVEQGNYTLAAVNTVTVVLQTYLLLNTVKDT